MHPQRVACSCSINIHGWMCMMWQRTSSSTDAAHIALSDEMSNYRSNLQHCQQELAAAQQQVLHLEAMLAGSARELDALQVLLSSLGVVSSLAHPLHPVFPLSASVSSESGISLNHVFHSVCVRVCASLRASSVYTVCALWSRQVTDKSKVLPRCTHSISCCSSKSRQERSTGGSGSWR
jgi:hypothetical protein